MKKILAICFSIFLFSFQVLADLYSIKFTTIEGEEKAMGTYQGKKMLILVLPGVIRESDTTYLKAINSASFKNQQLTIIAVPSKEDGYSSPASVELNQWYRNYLGNEVVITEGMYTEKTSAAQHVLFSWLTNKDKNMHFDEDVKGVGHKFFINESGELYGVFDPQAPLSDRLLGLMLN